MPRLLRMRLLAPALALGAATLLGGCVAYAPGYGYGYPGYYGYPYGYAYGGPAVSFGYFGYRRW